MQRKFLIVVALLAVACWAGAASANTLTLTTLAGSTTSGGTVDAQAIVTTLDGQVQVQLTNLLANPGNIAQCISDFCFTLVGSGFTLTGESTTQGGGTPIIISATAPHSYTFDAPIVGTTGLGWPATQSGSMFCIDVLGSGGAGPANLIIGPADSSNNYSNSNASIWGGLNQPHQPVLLTDATFFLNITGVTSTTPISPVATFSFGTSGENVYVPIPPSALLLGSGLLGLGLIGWRRKKS